MKLPGPESPTPAPPLPRLMRQRSAPLQNAPCAPNLRRYFAKMTVEELKAEAAKLSTDARLDLADWLAGDDDVREARRDRLRSEVQKGAEQIQRGQFVECRDSQQLHAFFEQIKARGRERLASPPPKPAG
jgi:hypothetical protein